MPRKPAQPNLPAAFGDVIPFRDVANAIIELRGEKVILDYEIASLYGVETKHVNQAVKNNPDKFPLGYVMVPTLDEWEDLRSKFLTANPSPMSRTIPKAFTERGLYMLATILKSGRATAATLAIVDTFAKVRGLKRELVELHAETDRKQQSQKMRHFGQALTEIVMPDLETVETESTLELNFIIGKIKHTVKRVKKR